MNSTILSLVSFIGTLIPILVGGIRFKRLPQPAKVFYFFLIAATIFSILSHLIPRQMSSLGMILLSVAELVCFGYVFTSSLGGAKFPKVILDIGLLLLIGNAIYAVSSFGHIYGFSIINIIPAITSGILCLYYCITSIGYRISNGESMGQRYLAWFVLATIFYFLPYLWFIDLFYSLRGTLDYNDYRTLLASSRFISLLLFALFFMFAKEEDLKSHAQLARFLSGPYTRWPVLIKDLKFSSDEFYTVIEKNITARNIPDVSYKRVKFFTTGLLSAQRVYFRISRKRLTYDVCAAPFGNQFFVSSWFGTRLPFFFEIPIIGKILEWWLSPKTYYQHDSNSMFMQTVTQCIQEAVDEMIDQQSLKGLTEDQKKTIQIQRL
jgi:hypothetical protein